MDIIDSYDKLTLGKYQEIQDIYADEGLDELDRQAQVLSVLTGISADEILHLPIGEYKELVSRASYLSPDRMAYHPVASRYLLGGFELVPVRDYRKLETCQYYDFQTYAPLLEKYQAEFLSVILVPKGHRYNEGYDILEVQKAIREEMSVADAASLTGFFLPWCATSIQDSLNCSRQAAAGLRDRRMRRRILRQIRELESLLPTSGGGSPT